MLITKISCFELFLYFLWNFQVLNLFSLQQQQQQQQLYIHTYIHTWLQLFHITTDFSLKDQQYPTRPFNNFPFFFSFSSFLTVLFTHFIH